MDEKESEPVVAGIWYTQVGSNGFADYVGKEGIERSCPKKRFFCPKLALNSRHRNKKPPIT